jgi:hypothetical protein
MQLPNRAAGHHKSTIPASFPAALERRRETRARPENEASSVNFLAVAKEEGLIGGACVKRVRGAGEDPRRRWVIVSRRERCLRPLH